MSDAIGQLLLSDQLIDLGKDICSGKVLIKDPDTFGKSKGKKFSREASAKPAEKIPYVRTFSTLHSRIIAVASGTA